METIKLSNGGSLPALGLGTWKSKPDKVTYAVEMAIKAGYRHIDCAAVYGNEKEVAQALKSCIGKTVNRKDLFITSKLWNTKHNPTDVHSAAEQTHLGLNYLDLYLIHWPVSFKDGDVSFPKDDDGNIIYAYHDPCDTWKAMETLVDDGLFKAIGILNFNSKQVDDILSKSRIKPAVLQVECHPYFNQAQLIEHCRKRDIVVTAYSPLGSPGCPQAKQEDWSLLHDPKIEEIANKYGKSPAQVCICFQIQRGVSVIPKSVTPAHIQSNFEVFDFTLSDDDMRLVESINKSWRVLIPMKEVDGKKVPRDSAHPHYPFNIPF
nr:aldo-keto reductase family 1 member A1-like [Pocillopora verrucosa]